MQPLVFLDNRTPSAKALELVHFDCDSILQTAAGKSGVKPTVFLADADRYERSGRLLRDSESPRLLAYSPNDKTLYANDGCNSCTHQLSVDLAKLDAQSLHALAETYKIPEALLTGIADLVR